MVSLLHSIRLVNYGCKRGRFNVLLFTDRFVGSSDVDGFVLGCCRDGKRAVAFSFLRLILGHQIWLFWYAIVNAVSLAQWGMIISMLKRDEILRSAILLAALVVGVSCASGESLGVGVKQGGHPEGGDAVGSARGGVGLNNAQLIRLRVPGYRALTGEFLVSSEGSLALPGLGRVDVSKLTSVALEERLRRLIYQISNREANVAVEIARYRSFYVSGTVGRSGAFEWRPGMSVVHAVALAGGVLRGPLPGQAAANNGSDPASRVRRSRRAFDLAVARATIERLRIERKGGSEYFAPKGLEKLVGEQELQRLITRQRTLLRSRREAYEARVSSLNSAKTLAVQELAALEMQRVRIKEQLVNRKGMRDRVRRLAEQGYSRADRVFEEQVRVAQLEERLTTTTLGISRMTMAGATAQQELELFVRGRITEIDVELLDLEQRVGQLEIQLSSALQELATGAASSLGVGSATEVVAEEAPPKFEIIRRQGNSSVVVNADRTTALQPGDVLIVL